MTPRALLASYFTIAGDVHPFSNDVPSPFEFRHRVEAAGRAGFRGIGLFHTDLVPVIARYGYAQMRRILADNGMDWVEVECLFNWFADGDVRAASDRQRSLLLEAATELGAFHVKVATDMSKTAPLDRLIADFARLAEDAARAGTKASLEMTPFSSTPDLASVMAVVAGANHPCGGLMLDMWHVARGGMTQADVAALPRGIVFGVELDDAAADVQGDLLEDTLDYRRYCGDGTFDLTGFIDALDSIGFAGPWGVEVLSREVRSLPLDIACKRAYDTTARAFARSAQPAIQPGDNP